MTTEETKKESEFDFDRTLPYTITVLDAPEGGKVYLVGTAHFSIESQKEVAKLIKKVQPTAIVLELCSSRVNILKLDEETVLREAKDMNMTKVIQLIKKTSLVHGLLQSLLIRLYAKVTEELGLAPGGEFRVAYNESKKINGCKVVLGDMPINLTLKRGFQSLPWYRKLKLAWILLTTDYKLTKEDVEELKRSDILETLVKEFGDSFPEFKRVLIDERDMYLTQSLRNNYNPVKNPSGDGDLIPARVVGVIGLGHAAGIKANWDKQFDINSILNETKKPSKLQPYARHFKYTMLMGTIAIIAYQVLKRKQI